MNTMNMPGFNADNSLYYSGRKYNMPSAATERSSSVVEPQLRASDGGLSKCDDDWGSCTFSLLGHVRGQADDERKRWDT